MNSLTRLLTLAASVLLLEQRALASSEYPARVQSQLGLNYQPPCQYCHAGPTNLGDVTTPFGAALRARGLVFDDVQSLDHALGALQADSYDSDRDGIPDITQLRDNRNPNGPSYQQPSYGCSDMGRIPHGTPWLGLLLPAMLWFGRRRVAR